MSKASEACSITLPQWLLEEPEVLNIFPFEFQFTMLWSSIATLLFFPLRLGISACALINQWSVNQSILCAGGCTHVCHNLCGTQKTTYGIQFSLKVLETELRLLGLVIRVFASWVHMAGPVSNFIGDYSVQSAIILRGTFGLEFLLLKPSEVWGIKEDEFHIRRWKESLGGRW